jgi:hypothetical protein
MKVFQVVIEYENKDKEIIKENNFVTAKGDDILTVTEHFKRRCYELEMDLISVTEILTISEHIEYPTKLSEKLKTLYIGD